MTVKTLINAIDSGKTLEIEAAFESIMADKVATKLDNFRQQVAKNMFVSQFDEETEELEEQKSSLVDHAVKMAAHHVDHDTGEDDNAPRKISRLHKKIEATHGKEVADAVRQNARSEAKHNTTSTPGVPEGHHEFVKKHLGGHGSPEHKEYLKKMKDNHMDSQSHDSDH